MSGAALPRPGFAQQGGTIFTLVGMLLTVGAVLALAYWVTRWIGRHGAPGWTGAPRKQGQQMELLWQLSLGRNERLVLVRLEKRCLLLGVTGGGIRLLTELTEEEAAPWQKDPGAAPCAPSFLDILRDNLPKKK